ncbi:hypothetical protein [Lentzea sp. NPDC051838]|uniref:hypothetical protein n=1 Tax=Lentzea sp. NPDC051838 TaxID=3154849 RepID=UPI0034418D2C
MESATLHTMARRYLMSRTDKLHAEAARAPKMPSLNGAHPGYTEEEKRIFPRFHVVNAMLSAVERLDPEDLPPLSQVASTLSIAASTAQSIFTTDRDPIATEAGAAERELFRRAIKGWLVSSDVDVEPLPYRRVFSDEEAAGWRRGLERRWGVHQTLWHPLISEDVPEDVLVLDSLAMWDGGGIELVREALAALGVRRVTEIREFGDPGARLDLELLVPTYDGAEGYWTDDTLDWLVYASHEQSVAFGGTLAERLRTSWPNLADWAYVPPWGQPAK